MIYLGVHSAITSFNVIALADSFAQLGHENFSGIHSKGFRQWLDSLKTCADEPVQWFFDQYQYRNPGCSTKVFGFDDNTDSIFLVNHRALYNRMQFVYQWLINQRILTPHHTLEVALFLASARMLFDENQIILLNSELRVC